MTPTKHGAPSLWITRFMPEIPPAAQILDLACGTGRHVKLFLDHGHNVTGVDIDISKCGDLARRPRLELIAADLEGGPWPLQERQFEAVVVTNFLWRPLMGHILDAVAPNGLLLYETFGQGNEAFGKPRNPEFLLAPEELLTRVGDGFSVIAYEHGRIDRPDPAILSRICARKKN